MKILLKGYYGFGNFGDDILMLTSYRLLKEKFPSAEIVIFSNFTKNLTSFNRSESYNHYIYTVLGDQPSLVDWTYRSYFDLVFNGGGGVFFDIKTGGLLYRLSNFFNKKLGVHFVSRIDKYLRAVLNKQSNLTFGRQIGFGIGIGPYTTDSPLLVRHMASIGTFAALIVRDRKSLDFLNEIKFRGEKYQFTDMAFFKDYWLSKEFMLKKKEYSGKLGIILQDLPSTQDKVFVSIKEFVGQLQNVEVTFFSFDKNHDQQFVPEFSGSTLRVWEPDKMKMSDFLTLLQNQDVIISARAHGAIVAALLGVIPICLGVSQKLIEVSRYFPTGGKIVNDPSSTNELIACWRDVVSNHSSLQAALQNDVEQNIAVAGQSKEKLFELL